MQEVSLKMFDLEPTIKVKQDELELNLFMLFSRNLLQMY